VKGKTPERYRFALRTPVVHDFSKFHGRRDYLKLNMFGSRATGNFSIRRNPMSDPYRQQSREYYSKLACLTGKDVPSKSEAGEASTPRGTFHVSRPRRAEPLR